MALRPLPLTACLSRRPLILLIQKKTGLSVSSEEDHTGRDRICPYVTINMIMLTGIDINPVASRPECFPISFP